MTAEEAISALQTRIKYPEDDTYGGMCEAEYQQEAVDAALAALRQQAEREKGCVWCQHHTHLFGKIYELNAVLPVVCPWCGRKLENQP